MLFLLIYQDLLNTLINKNSNTNPQKSLHISKKQTKSTFNKNFKGTITTQGSLLHFMKVDLQYEFFLEIKSSYSIQAGIKRFPIKLEQIYSLNLFHHALHDTNSISILSFIINQRVEDDMPSVQTLQKFYEVLLDKSQRKPVEILEFNQKASRGCPIKFTLQLAQHLQISEQLTLAGLLIVKRTIENNLKISKKFLHRLIVVGLLIAEKCFEEEQNEVQTYSLLSGVPIKDIVLLEEKVLNILDYRVLPQDGELDHILREDAWGLFLNEDSCQ